MLILFDRLCKLFRTYPQQIPEIDKTTRTTQDRNSYLLGRDNDGKQSVHAIKQESSPSKDHVKQWAATLLHNKRLFIFSPPPHPPAAGGYIVWRGVFISRRLFAFLRAPFTRQWMFTLRLHARDQRRPIKPPANCNRH